jgi:hypothetical protein
MEAIGVAPAVAAQEQGSVGPEARSNGPKSFLESSAATRQVRPLRKELRDDPPRLGPSPGGNRSHAYPFLFRCRIHAPYQFTRCPELPKSTIMW